MSDRPARPRRPAPSPIEVDDVRIVAAGTALWLVATLVLGVLRLTGTLVTPWLWTAVAGTVLGAVGVGYCRRRRARLAHDPRTRAAESAPPVEPLT